MLGDGHRNSKNYDATGIVSKILAEEIYVLALQLGYFPSISFRPAYEGSEGQAHADSWTVSWLAERKEPAKWRRRFKHEDFILSRVEKTETSENTITAVYDFTVDSEHSFVADGVLVHNCYGVGWFWDEYKIVYYKNDDVFRTSGGIPKQDASHFYIEYDEDIAPIDIIVEVEVDKEGEITYPIKRKGFYDIRVVEDFRADDGRLEYWRITGGYIRDWSVYYEQVRHRQYG